MLGYLLALFLLPQSPGFQSIEAGQQLQGSLSEGGSITYVLELEAGDRVEGSVWQQTVDVTVDVLGPDGEFIDSFDYFRYHVDPFRFRAMADGEYQIQLHAVGNDQGFFQILVSLAGPEAIDRKGKARQFLGRYLDNLQGTQVAVIQKGELLLAEARGLANLEYNAAMTLDTPCRAEVMLLQFLQVAILRMEDAGLLTMETPVHEVLEGFPVYDPPLKVIHLIQGRSGLPDMRKLWQFATGVEGGWPTVEQQLSILDAAQGLVFEPGTRVDSGKDCYVVMQGIVAQASKRGLEPWVQKRILDELQMNDTEIIPADTEVLGRAKIYGTNPAGGLKRAWLIEDEITVFTTMNDWILWATFLTTEGEDGQSPWQRLMALEAHVPDFAKRQQAGFRFDPHTETWLLELRNGVYRLYPGWAIESLEEIFLSEHGWALEHPGQGYGLNNDVGLGGGTYSVTKKNIKTWSGRFVGENISAVLELRSQGRVLFVKSLAGLEAKGIFFHADKLFVVGRLQNFTAIERNEAGEVTVFEAFCGGLPHLRFVREDRPKKKTRR